jgi:hypothetical protein
MIENYRKLTAAEVEQLSKQLARKFKQREPSKLENQIATHVKKYYSDDARSAVLTINAEYNDEGYNCSAGYLTVYNGDGDELLPKKEDAQKSRKEWQNLDVPDSHEEDPPEDVTVLLHDAVIPDLYIKKP